MTLRAFLIGTLTALAAVSCGGGGGNFAGGIGGTGVSSGPATAFGSVIVNGVEYDTRSASFFIEGAPVGSGATGQNKLAVGMVVSVTHDGNGTAKSVSYSDNAQGPVANLNTGAGTFEVLGITVTVNSLTVFAGGITDITTGLNAGDIVEVSGQLTGTNALLATRVEKLSMTCPLSAGQKIEVKGTVDNVSSSSYGGHGGFTIGTLNVDANNLLPDKLTSNDYVEVTSSACPSGGILVASAIKTTEAGPDLSHLDPGEHELEVKGIVAQFASNATDCTFFVNGQSVKASGSQCNTLANGTLVEVHGQVDSGGVLIVSGSIDNEDGGEHVADHFTGQVYVDTHTSPFQGTIHVGSSATTITVTLNTQFEVEGTQTYNLDSMASSPSCAEVQINSSNIAVSIHKEDCH